MDPAQILENTGTICYALKQKSDSAIVSPNLSPLSNPSAKVDTPMSMNMKKDDSSDS